MSSPRTALAGCLELTQLPVALALMAVLIGGIFLLERAEAQARDTIRKHHLADVEQAIALAERQHGTYPPYDQPAWCGKLNAESNRDLRDQIEVALRQQNAKYANPAKPFPVDPAGADYFYWKRSPTTFELFAGLEADNQGTFTTTACDNDPGTIYTYNLNSRVRSMNEVL